MPMDKKTYNITLCGRKYTFASSEGDLHVKRVADLTRRCIEETMLLSKSIGFETAAAATALQFGEEIIRLQDELTRLRRELGDDKTRGD